MSKSILFLVLFFAVSVANAAATGGGIPWDGPLTNFANSISGPTAYAICLIGIVAAGMTAIFAAGEFAGLIRMVCGLVMLIALVVGARAFLNMFGVAGALV